MPSIPKGRNEKGKFLNKHLSFKAKVRRFLNCTASDDVFDMFAGDGEMYRRCYGKAKSGVTCDLEDNCIERAAMDRPRWICLQVNVEKILRAGLWRDRPFSIIDIDCFGSPWKFFAGLFKFRRSLANPCRLVLTDNYMTHRNLSHEDLVLEFRKPGSPEEYLAAVDRLMKKTVVAQGWSYDRKLYRDGTCVNHLITMSRPAAIAVGDTGG